MEERILYRLLENGECNRIQEVDASQYITRAWRKVGGILQLVDIDYLEPGFPEGLDCHLHRLQRTVNCEGSAIGAFADDGTIVGFSALNIAPFGKTHRYALLDQLFISRNDRRKGIGRQLFLLTAALARRNHAQKLYICAGSSEETVAFYRALGCVDAMEVNPALYRGDPRDIQLEYSV